MEAEEHHTRPVEVGSLLAAAVDVRTLIEGPGRTPAVGEVVHSLAVEAADRILGPGAGNHPAADRIRWEQRRTVQEVEHHTGLEAGHRDRGRLGDESFARPEYHRMSRWSRA